MAKIEENKKNSEKSSAVRLSKYANVIVFVIVKL